MLETGKITAISFGTQVQSVEPMLTTTIALQDGKEVKAQLSISKMQSFMKNMSNTDIFDAFFDKTVNVLKSVDKSLGYILVSIPVEDMPIVDPDVEMTTFSAVAYEPKLRLHGSFWELVWILNTDEMKFEINKYLTQEEMAQFIKTLDVSNIFAITESISLTIKANDTLSEMSVSLSAKKDTDEDKFLFNCHNNELTLIQ